MGNDQNLVDAFLKNTIPTIKGEATKYERFMTKKTSFETNLFKNGR